MLKKTFLLGIAVLCLSILTGCPMEPSFEAVSFPKELPIDSPPFKDVSYLGQLQDALDDDTTNNIRIVDNITLSGISLIPKQKKVEIMPQKNVTISEPITIEGSVNIMEQARLTISDAGDITGIINIMDDADMLVRAPLDFESSELVFTVEPRGRVLIEEGVAITLNGEAAIKGQVSLGNNAQMTVADKFEMDGDLTLHHGAVLVLEDAASGGVNGTITVLKGGHIWDQAEDGGWAWKEQGLGKIVFQYGSYASIGPGGKAVKVVDSVFNDGSQFILTSTASRLTIQKDEYLLEGDAVLADNYSIENTLRLSKGVLKTSSGKSFSLKPGGNLIIENQGVLELVQGTTGELQGAIEVKNGGKYVDARDTALFFSNGDTGSITFDAGSVGLINGKTEIGTNQAGGAPGGTLQLEDGK
ncbi:MAG: hypothetical protein LBP42_06550, partial [Treponema sp.]|nr:hypothetical protein [Treponema sp.]